MSTNIDIDSDLQNVEITTKVNDTVTEDNSHIISPVENESIVEGFKREYSIVGDGLYASTTSDEAPLWLTSIIDDVVSTAVSSNQIDYNLLVQDVRNAIDSIDIARNTYVEQIDITPLVDGIITSRFESLNATLENTYATRVELSVASATTTSALTLFTTDLVAGFNDDTNSRITNVELAYAAEDLALANSIEALSVSLVSQEEDLTAAADAVSGLQTYVGISPSSTPNGTGMLSRIQVLENQNDGVVQVLSGTYDVMIGIGDPNTDPSDDELDTTVEPYASWIAIDNTNSNEDERIKHVGDVYIQYDASTGAYLRAFKFIKVPNDITPPFATDLEGYTWALITDTDAASAYAIALEARRAADGKLSQFYGWRSSNAPSDVSFVSNPEDLPENHITEVIDGDSFVFWLKNSNNLYYKPNTTWIRVPTVIGSGDVYIAQGDQLTVFDPVTRDHSFYTYNGVSWQLVGPEGIVSNSKFFVDLSNDVRSETGSVGVALANLEIRNKAYTDGEITTVSNSFDYNSTLMINGDYYNTGFGLNSSGAGSLTQPAGADGNTPATAFDSEFWVNAERFVITSPDDPSIRASFKVENGSLVLGVENTQATRNNVTGPYNPNTTYLEYDIVEHLGSSYSAKRTTKGDTPSTSPDDWQLFASVGPQGGTGPQGVAGPIGPNGQTTYTWIRYATNSAGANISNSPISRTYIGFAYNKTTATESNTPSDYEWALIQGPQGNTGVEGPPGPNGQPTYTWIKYSANSNGSGLTDSPQSNTAYIGIAPNKTTATESITASDYTWSLFKGPQGETGPTGGQGPAGSPGSTGAGFYGGVYGGIDFNTSGANPRFQTLTGRQPVLNDIFTQSRTDGTDSQSRRYNGASWVTAELVINGSLIVDDTIGASQIVAGAINAQHLNVTGSFNESSGITRSFKINPNAENPISFSRVVNGLETPLFAVQNDPDTNEVNMFLSGKLSKDTVDIDSIQEEARIQINPYYQGTNANSLKSITTTATATSFSTLLPAVTVFGGLVNVSYRLQANRYLGFGSSIPSAPSWVVTIRRGGSSGSVVGSKTYTGATVVRGQEPNGGGTTFYEWDSSILIDDFIVDTGVTTSTAIYHLSVSRVSNSSDITSITRTLFQAHSPSFKRIEMELEYTPLFDSISGIDGTINNGNITLAEDMRNFEFISVVGSHNNKDAIRTEFHPVADIVSYNTRSDFNDFMLYGDNTTSIPFWRVSPNSSWTVLTRVADLARIYRISGVNIVEK